MPETIKLPSSPPSSKSKKHTISVLLPDDLTAELDRLAEESRRSRGSVIRILLQAAVKEAEVE